MHQPISRVLLWTAPTSEVPAGALPFIAWLDPAGEGPVTREDVAVVLDGEAADVRALHVLSYL